MTENNIPVKKGAAVIAFKDGKVLLVSSGEKSGHASGVYALPSGSLDENESYIDAAAREFEEESGLKTETKYLVKLPTFYEAELLRKDGLKKFCAWAYYCSKYWGEIKESDEGEPQWVDLSELKNYRLQVNVDKMISEAQEYLDNKGLIP